MYERFVKCARRRWVAWRVMESAAVGAAITASVGLLLMSVLFWRGQAALAPAAWLLAIGALAGATRAIQGRPTLLQTAIEADRQLQLHDLLSTALCSRAWRDAPFARTIQAQADAACRGGAVHDLILKRLSARAWGGIGLIWSLLLTVAMMTTSPIASRAQRNDSSYEWQYLDDTGQSKGSETINVMPKARAGREIGGTGVNGDPDQEGETSIAPRQGVDPSAPGREMPGSGASVQRASGNGSNSGRTDLAHVPTLPQPVFPELPAADGGVEGKYFEGNTSQLTNVDASAWRGIKRPTDRPVASPDIKSGNVPDMYRDMVREYFTPGQDHSAPESLR